MSVKYDFSDRVVIITGAGSGIGAATAVLFARSGAQVVMVDINGQRLANVAKECQSVSPNDCEFLEVVVDITKDDDRQRIVDSVVKRFGKINVLVNNAGNPLVFY